MSSGRFLFVKGECPMNEILRSLTKRKSVRAYEDRPVDPAHKQAILEAALQAPTAGNMMLYTILDITDPTLKQTLSITCDNQPFIAKAPMVLIFLADYSRWHAAFCGRVAEVRAPGEGDLLLAFSDALIAAQNAVVAAESLGLGSCYIGDILENYEQHKSLLSLPDHVAPVCMVCFGYPTAQQQARPKPPRFPLAYGVCENTYRPVTGEQVEAALMEKEGLSPASIGEWLEKFCRRKWNSDFSVEMSRSAAAMIADWCKED